MKNLIKFIKENVYKKTELIELENYLIITMKKIIILAGGYSREREISIQTANAVFKQIRKEFNCKILDPKNNFIQQIRKFKPM